MGRLQNNQAEEGRRKTVSRRGLSIYNNRVAGTMLQIVSLRGIVKNLLKYGNLNCNLFVGMLLNVRCKKITRKLFIKLILLSVVPLVRGSISLWGIREETYSKAEIGIAILPAGYV